MVTFKICRTSIGAENYDSTDLYKEQPSACYIVSKSEKALTTFESHRDNQKAFPSSSISIIYKKCTREHAQGPRLPGNDIKTWQRTLVPVLLLALLNGNPVLLGRRGPV